MQGKHPPYIDGSRVGAVGGVGAKQSLPITIAFFILDSLGQTEYLWAVARDNGRRTRGGLGVLQGEVYTSSTIARLMSLSTAVAIDASRSRPARVEWSIDHILTEPVENG